MFDLSKRVAVVTGASSGIGVQMAKAFARQGAKVALLARRADKLQKVADDIKAAGGDAMAISCDVTQTENIQAALAQILKAWGKVDILLTAAGMGVPGKAEDLSDEAWDKVIDLNLNALYKCCREFGREMLKNGYGRIINIASMYGLVGNAINPASPYHASKGAVVNLTHALAAEWGKRGVTVNAIGPGFFASELTQTFIDAPEFVAAVKAYCPMGRVGREGELDAAAVFLASDEASYVNGLILTVDGGWTAI